MQIDVILLWLSLAIVTGILYTAPKYFLDKAREGFAALTGQQLKDLRGMLVAPVYNASAAPSLGSTSVGVTVPPTGSTAGSTKSTPSHADVQNCSSLSDGQGAILNEKKKTYQCPKPTVIYKTQTQYVPAPAKECPDLRNFIRKDQIPCWNCKLPA